MSPDDQMKLLEQELDNNLQEIKATKEEKKDLQKELQKLKEDTQRREEEKKLEEKYNKKKLNWIEKKMIKNMIKKAHKTVNKQKNTIEEQAKQRQILEKELLSMTDVLNIETDQGEPLNHKNIKKQSTKEIEETFKQALKEMEKLI